MLKKRGEYIVSSKIGKLVGIEADLNHMSQDKLEKYSRPVTAFITFRNELGREILLKLFKKETNWLNQKKNGLGGAFKVLNTELEVKEPPEPSIIKWENLYKDDWYQKKYKCKVYTFTLIIFILTITILAVLKGWIVGKNNALPPTIECNSEMIFHKDVYKKFAIND